MSERLKAAKIYPDKRSCLTSPHQSVKRSTNKDEQLLSAKRSGLPPDPSPPRRYAPLRASAGWSRALQQQNGTTGPNAMAFKARPNRASCGTHQCRFTPAIPVQLTSTKPCPCSGHKSQAHLPQHLCSPRRLPRTAA